MKIANQDRTGFMLLEGTQTIKANLIALGDFFAIEMPADLEEKTFVVMAIYRTIEQATKQLESLSAFCATDKKDFFFELEDDEPITALELANSLK